jgi:alpha-amylase
MHVHQPWRVRQYSAFDTGVDHNYWGAGDGEILRKVADKSYFPTNAALIDMLNTYPEFRVSLSITGTFIEQCEYYLPELLESFRALVDAGRSPDGDQSKNRVEIVGETYYHSLAFFYSRSEFDRQVAQHAKRIEEVFDLRPTAFRNTELAYNNDLGKWADTHGYKAILAEGWDKVLDWRSPNWLYKPPGTDKVKLLLKNYKLSDDMAFRFSNRDWSEYPLTSSKYAAWLDAEDAPLVNLFVDYETFGEHHWEDTGIFNFLKALPHEWLSRPEHTFMTVSQAADFYEVKDEVSMPHVVTWADTERDLSAWLGNRMQQEANHYIYAMEQHILETGDVHLIGDWRRLTTSDHAYYMSTKYWNDGDVHAYFSPKPSPFDAFIDYMNALRDVRFRLIKSHTKGS